MNAEAFFLYSSVMITQCGGENLELPLRIEKIEQGHLTLKLENSTAKIVPN